MSKLRAFSKIKRLIADEAGTVGLDYGMIASLIAVALITGLSSVGNNLGTSFRTAANALLTAPTPNAPPPAAAPPNVAPTKAAPRAKP